MNIRSTIFSADRVHRYTLYREWERNSRFVNFICLNPSTADEQRNDPTMRRCINFARDWGYSAMVVTNIFAYRSTDPAALRHAADPIGPDNDDHIKRVAKEAALIVCAWGGIATDRGHFVRHYLADHKLHYLRLTAATRLKYEFPHHPLYLPRDLRPKEWI